jgi:hypothetical protein
LSDGKIPHRAITIKGSIEGFIHLTDKRLRISVAIIGIGQEPLLNLSHPRDDDNDHNKHQKNVFDDGLTKLLIKQFIHIFIIQKKQGAFILQKLLPVFYLH